MLWASIDDIHGPVSADGRPCLYPFDGPFAYVLHLLKLLIAQLAQNIVYLLASAELIADAEAYACILLSPDQLIYVGQTVVSSGASVLPQTDRAERDVEVVGNDQEVSSGIFSSFIQYLTAFPLRFMYVDGLRRVNLLPLNEIIAVLPYLPDSKTILDA